MNDSQVCELVAKEDLLSHLQWRMLLKLWLNIVLLFSFLSLRSHFFAMNVCSYGSTGDGKDIPPESWLVYDVELVKVH